VSALPQDAPAPASVAGFEAWLAGVGAEPWRYDFYQAMRHIEAAHPQLPRLGEAQRPGDEPLRVSQPPELNFAPASLHGVQHTATGVLRLQQRIFGLIGPNGPLPIHLTEYVRERAMHAGDATLLRFLDLLTHRFALLFYRAWAQAQPVVSLDRAGNTDFSRRLGALIGIGEQSLLGRDAAGDAAKLHFSGRLGRQVRDADGLLNWIRSEFGVPVQVRQWRGHWMPLGRDERTRLHPPLQRTTGQQLGRGAVLGATVWDVQHKFRIVIGPVREARYHAFLPGGRDLARLQALVRQWVGLEFQWDLQLILARADVPPLRLARSGELGRSCWLGHFKKNGDADDLVLDVERTLTTTKTTSRQGQAHHE
jgi:type VI secretion system protein ImpH